MASPGAFLVRLRGLDLILALTTRLRAEPHRNGD